MLANRADKIGGRSKALQSLLGMCITVAVSFSEFHGEKNNQVLKRVNFYGNYQRLCPVNY
jgi:hypothetical protein